MKEREASTSRASASAHPVPRSGIPRSLLHSSHQSQDALAATLDCFRTLDGPSLSSHSRATRHRSSVDMRHSLP